MPLEPPFHRLRHCLALLLRRASTWPHARSYLSRIISRGCSVLKQGLVVKRRGGSPGQVSLLLRQADPPSLLRLCSFNRPQRDVAADDTSNGGERSAVCCLSSPEQCTAHAETGSQAVLEPQRSHRKQREHCVQSGSMGRFRSGGSSMLM